MAIHHISHNDTYTTDVTVCEGDKFTQTVYVKFDRHMIPEEIRGCNEMFISPAELYRLGKFLMQQAEIINVNQLMRQDTGA